MLARRDVASASQFLSGISHASGQNYILTDVSGLADFEASAAGVVPWRPWPDSHLVWHTNHPLCAEGGSDQGLAATGGDANSVARLGALDRRLAHGTFHPSLEAMKEALTSRDDPYAPIAREHVPGRHDLGFTFATVIWEIAPEPCSPRGAGTGACRSLRKLHLRQPGPAPPASPEGRAVATLLRGRSFADNRPRAHFRPILQR